jgi:hypothetical protein
MFLSHLNMYNKCEQQSNSVHRLHNIKCYVHRFCLMLEVSTVVHIYCRGLLAVSFENTKALACLLSIHAPPRTLSTEGACLFSGHKTREKGTSSYLWLNTIQPLEVPNSRWKNFNDEKLDYMKFSRKEYFVIRAVHSCVCTHTRCHKVTIFVVWNLWTVVNGVLKLWVAWKAIISLLTKVLVASREGLLIGGSDTYL